MRSILLAALLLSAPAALAQALPRPEETLKAFGLYGRLAPNCSIRLAKEPLIYVERADGTEDQVRITTRKDGKIGLELFSLGRWFMANQHVTGWSPKRYVIKSARQLNDNEVELLITSEEQLPNRYYVWEKKGGKFRLKSIRDMAGNYSAKDHRVLTTNGREFQWLTACPAD